MARFWISLSQRTVLTHRLRNRAVGVFLVALLLSGIQGCATLPPTNKVASSAISRSAETALGRVALQSVPASTSGFRAMPTSSFSLDARISLARAAQRTLDLQYYLLQSDATGETLMRAIRDAAERGVRVRLLVDDLYTATSGRMLRDIAAYDNVQVRLFNPFPAGRSLMVTRWAFSLLDLPRLNHRMHNKLFIADSAFAVAGGRNIADEYFFNSHAANFIDFDLLISGKAVADLASVFDEYWNSPRVYPIEELESSSESPEARRADFDAQLGLPETPTPLVATDAKDMLGYAPLATELIHPPVRLLYGSVKVLADNPEKVAGRSETGDDPTTVTSQAVAVYSSATSELLLASPYFVPGAIGMDAIGALRDRGVATTVITNSLGATDEPFASAAYSHYRTKMLRLGVAIYEISREPPDLSSRPSIQIASKGRSHAKIAVVDRKITFVGSMNLDLRSSRENTEIGLLIESPELAEQVRGLLEQLTTRDSFRLSLSQPGDKILWSMTQNGEVKVYDEEPDVTRVTRLKLFLFAPLLPDVLF